MASATGSTNIGAIQVAAKTTGNSAVATATSIPTGALASSISALSRNSSSLLGNSSAPPGNSSSSLLGNSTSTSNTAMPAGTTFENLMAWIYDYVKGITG